MIDELVTTLLYEGYALYPYTPDATKNATPTPFGIVYPPAYARDCEGAHDHARLECVAWPAPGAELSAMLRCLRPSGAAHEARELRAEVGPLPPGARRSEQFDDGRVTLRSEPRDDGSLLVRACVHNTAVIAMPAGRAAALERSLISTHVLVTISAGRFESPLERGGAASVNIWPVLATDRDDAVLGAAIVLPDHPRLAPRSRGDLFDGTEIEEALLLHVRALSDEEREQIAAADPAVHAIVERALAATPADIVDLHGGMTEVRR
jgi:hypothetical protein